MAASRLWPARPGKSPPRGRRGSGRARSRIRRRSCSRAEGCARWPSPWRSSKSIRPEVCALDETVTTRAGDPYSSRSRSSLLTRNGARWFSAKVRSSPSTVMCLLFQYSPTLFFSTSSRGRLRSSSPASRAPRHCQAQSGRLAGAAGHQDCPARHRPAVRLFHFQLLRHRSSRPCGDGWGPEHPVDPAKPRLAVLC